MEHVRRQYTWHARGRYTEKRPSARGNSKRERERKKKREKERERAEREREREIRREGETLLPG